MDNIQARSFNLRIDALEAAMQEVKYVLNLSSQPIESKIIAPAGEGAQKVPREEIVPTPLLQEKSETRDKVLIRPQSQARAICTECEGGNPPQSAKCMWCGHLMSAGDSPALPTRTVAIEQQEGLKHLSVSTLPAVPTKVTMVPLEAASYRQRPVAQISPVSATPTVTILPLSDAKEPRQPLSATIIHFADRWLQKIGMVIFLFGVAFLFKYSIDQGWLNEQVRVGMGLLFGAILMVAGLRLHKKRRHFSQVLLGGSIATYYITGYATYNIFPNLNLPYWVAFGFMSLVTLAAFALSIRQDEAILSIIGVTGGLITPFVLNGADIGLPGVVAYSTLVTVGASGIYLMKGWRSLLWTCWQSGWSVLLLGYIQHIVGSAWSGNSPLYSDRWALQTGIAVMVIAFWVVPVLREALFARNPSRWPRPVAPGFLYPEVQALIERHVQILTVATPIMALACSNFLWSSLVPKETWGVVVLGGAAVFAATYLLLRRYSPSLTQLAYTHAIVAIGLLTAGLAFILSGNALLIALAMEAAALHLLASRANDRGIANCGNLIFGAVGVWLAGRFKEVTGVEFPLWNPQALTDLAVIGIALAASFAASQRYAALTLRSLVHIAVLAWFWREMHALPNGDGYVMLAWATYGLLLHIIAKRTGDTLNSLGTAIAAHLAFEGALGLLAYRLASGSQGDATMFNEKAIIDLAMMALALAASFAVKSGKQGSSVVATIYRLCVHAAVMGWLWREATTLDVSNGYLMLRWAAYLAMVAFISHRIGDRITLAFTSFAFTAVGLLFAGRIFSPHDGDWAILNVKTLLDLTVLGLVLVTFFLAQPREVRTAMRLLIHAAILGLLWRELFTLNLGLGTQLLPYDMEGYGYTMLAWALYLSGLHLLARRTKDEATSIFAHVGFAAVAGILAWRLATPPDMTVAILNQKALIDLAVIALAAAMSFFVRQEKASLIYRYTVHAAVLALFARELYWLYEGVSYIMFAWAAYAALLYWLSLTVKKRRDQWMDVAAHALFATSGLLLLVRIMLGLILVNADQFAVLNPKGLTYLGIIALGAAMYAGVRWRAKDTLISEWRQQVMFAYALWLHFTFLGWTWQELGLIPRGGNGYVTIAWALYAVGLVVAGQRLRRNVPLLTAGITTLFAVAAKLFLIDLQYLDPIWRILLFLGFGGFFLLFSYFFQGVIRPGSARQATEEV